MAHLHRFYHAAPPEGADQITLSREESHHAMRVLRVRQGDEVALFNGAGTEWRGTLATLSRNDVVVTVTSERTIARPEPPVTLAQAWLHRDKVADEIVRQATVLGVAEILFFRGEHSEKKPRISEKWERLTIEACKQCGRLWLPRIDVVDNLEAVLSRLEGHRIAIARMDGPHVPLAQIAGTGPVACLIGPEGDFSDGELDRASASGVMPISLGDCTYRAEMAAQVGLTLIQYHLGHMGR